MHCTSPDNDTQLWQEHTLMFANVGKTKLISSAARDNDRDKACVCVCVRVCACVRLVLWFRRFSHRVPMSLLVCIHVCLAVRVLTDL